MKSGTQPTGTKRGKECTIKASNYRKILLNVSVMLQCIANTAWSQVTLSVRQGEKKKKKRRRRRVIERIRKSFQTAEMSHCQIDRY